MKALIICLSVVSAVIILFVLLLVLVKIQEDKEKEEDEKWLEYIKSRGKITGARFKRATAAYYNYKPGYPYIKEEQFEEHHYYLQSEIVRYTVNAMEDVITDKFSITCIKVLKNNTVVIIGTNKKGEEYPITIEKGTAAVSHAEITFEDNSKVVLY